MKSPNAVPGQPPNRYGCTGTAKEPSLQSSEAECRRHGGRRRAQLVIGGIVVIVGALAICDFVTTTSNYSFQQYASALLESADSPAKQPTAQDVADCSGFQGWLQADCLKSKTEDRKSVGFWTDEQVDCRSIVTIVKRGSCGVDPPLPPLSDFSFLFPLPN